MVRLTLHFLPMIGVALATEVQTCSVTGTCSDKIEHAILLQARESGANDNAIHRRFKLVSEIEHMVNKAVKLGAPLTTVQALVQATKKNEPGSWGDKEKKLFNDLIQSIETDMVNFLNTEHKSDKSLYDATKVQHELCHKHTSDRFGANGDIKNAEEAVGEDRTKHKSCRKMEKTWTIYQTAAGAACPTADLGLTKFEEHDKHKDLVTKITSLRADQQSYAAAGGSASNCDVNQVEFETEYCSWRKSKRAACTAEKQCIDAADLQGNINRVNTRIANRKAIFLTLKKVLCRIKHLLTTFDLPANKDVSDFDTADTCDNTPVDDSGYDISMPAVPTSPKCDIDGLVSVRPSKTDAGQCTAWRNQEFVNWATSDYVVPQTCQHDCSDDLPTTFVPDEGCTDDDVTQCAKFQHHQDMCTMDIYETSTFKPVTACCHCGGGTTASSAAAVPTTQVAAAVTSCDSCSEVGYDVTASDVYYTAPALGIQREFSADYKDGWLTSNGRHQNAWVQLALEQATKVDEFQIWNSCLHNDVKTVDIQSSTDGGSTFTTVTTCELQNYGDMDPSTYKKTPSSAQHNAEYCPVGGIEAQTWRIVLKTFHNKPAKDSPYSGLNRVRIMSASPPVRITQLAATATHCDTCSAIDFTPTASDNYDYANVAGLKTAFSTNYEHGWLTNNGKHRNAWAQFALAKASKVEEFQIWNWCQHNDVKNVEILYSTDGGSAWTSATTCELQNYGTRVGKPSSAQHNAEYCSVGGIEAQTWRIVLKTFFDNTVTPIFPQGNSGTNAYSGLNSVRIMGD